jgi:hypothetical protein
MPDQTRPEWIGDYNADGTLVIVAEGTAAPGLLQFIPNAPAQQFFFDDDEGLIKYYFSNVTYGFVSERSERFSPFYYAWIPGWIRDIFVGKCDRKDCSTSKICVRPGCICTRGRITGSWRCR